MSKELPYFRFTVSEWMNDDISLESYKTKGVFIDICAFYWFRDCEVTLPMIYKRFSNAKKIVDYLITTNVIKVNADETLCILFLDKQYILLKSDRRKKQYAGSLGGKQKHSNAIALLKQKPSYKDKDNNKENNKDKENEKKEDPRPLIGFSTKDYEILKEIDIEWMTSMMKRFNIERPEDFNNEMDKYCDHLFDIGDIRKTVKDFKSHYVNLKNKNPDFLKVRVDNSDEEVSKMVDELMDKN